ncbi:four helix bundle protein [Maioricimonas rarisocia]|uniref:four helix bundle protein n=1 Tax=Maioricimonas rarisocia TaxID=2528026 RepID=UPI0036F42689
MPKRITSHRDLVVWQKAMDLVQTCYRLTGRFPGSEQFGLTSQLRRAATSIPANIAEGKGRATTGAYLNHLSIAVGSVAEVDTYLELARRLQYITREELETAETQLEEVGKMLAGLKRSLNVTSSWLLIPGSSGLPKGRPPWQPMQPQRRISDALRRSSARRSTSSSPKTTCLISTTPSAPSRNSKA